jgi:hypothetical protein
MIVEEKQQKNISVYKATTFIDEIEFFVCACDTCWNFLNYKSPEQWRIVNKKRKKLNRLENVVKVDKNELDKLQNLWLE